MGLSDLQSISYAHLPVRHGVVLASASSFCVGVYTLVGVCNVEVLGTEYWLVCPSSLQRRETTRELRSFSFCVVSIGSGGLYCGFVGRQSRNFYNVMPFPLRYYVGAVASSRVRLQGCMRYRT